MEKNIAIWRGSYRRIFDVNYKIKSSTSRKRRINSSTFALSPLIDFRYAHTRTYRTLPCQQLLIKFKLCSLPLAPKCRYLILCVSLQFNSQMLFFVFRFLFLCKNSNQHLIKYIHKRCAAYTGISMEAIEIVLSVTSKGVGEKRSTQ